MPELLILIASTPVKQHKQLFSDLFDLF